MLTTLPHLLAADSDPSIKIIFGAIVAVIWIIGGVLSSLKKKGTGTAQNYAAQQDWSHLLRDLTGGQAKPWNPSTPVPPPPLPGATPQQQLAHRQRMQQIQQAQQTQQIKSYAQRSPRPFVQQYPPRKAVKQYPPRTMPPRRQAMTPTRAKPFKGPKPVVAKQKAQRRPQTGRTAPPGAPPVPHMQHAPVAENAVIATSAAGGSAGVHTSSSLAGRTATVRITSSQLRKLILWSEILAPPLSLREMSPK